MSHRSYSRERRAEREREKALRTVRHPFDFDVMRPADGLPSRCTKPDVHSLYVACAEAAFVRAFQRDEVLEDWVGHEVPGFGLLILHRLPCGCELGVTSC